MERLGLVLQRLQNTFNRNADNFARQLGLTGTQMLIIEYLFSADMPGSLYQKDLEHEFNIRKSTATNILRLMEQRGLISKAADPHDTRYKALILTEKAKQLQPQITSYFVESELETEHLLGRETKQKLLAELQQLDQELTEY